MLTTLNVPLVASIFSSLTLQHIIARLTHGNGRRKTNEFQLTQTLEAVYLRLPQSPTIATVIPSDWMFTKRVVPSGLKVAPANSEELRALRASW